MGNKILVIPKVSRFVLDLHKYGTQEAARKAYLADKNWSDLVEAHEQETANLKLLKSNFPLADIASTEYLESLIPDYDVFAFIGGDDHFTSCSQSVLKYMKLHPEDRKKVVGVKLNPAKSSGALLDFTVPTFLEHEHMIRNDSLPVRQDMVLEAMIHAGHSYEAWPAVCTYSVGEYCDAAMRRNDIPLPAKFADFPRRGSGLLISTPNGRGPGSWTYNASFEQARAGEDEACVFARESGVVKYAPLFRGEVLVIDSYNDHRGTVFPDGAEEHMSAFPMGARAEIRISDMTLPVVEKP